MPFTFRNFFILLAILLFAIPACELRRGQRFGAPVDPLNALSILYLPKSEVISVPKDINEYYAAIRREAPADQVVIVSKASDNLGATAEEIGRLQPGQTELLDFDVKPRVPYTYSLVALGKDGLEQSRKNLALMIPEGLYLNSINTDLFRNKKLKVGRLFLGPKAVLLTGGKASSLIADEIHAQAGAKILAWDESATDPEETGELGLLKVRALKASGILEINPDLPDTGEGPLNQSLDVRVKEAGNFAVAFSGPATPSHTMEEPPRSLRNGFARFDNGKQAYFACAKKWVKAELLLNIFRRPEGKDGHFWYLWFTPHHGLASVALQDPQRETGLDRMFLRPDPLSLSQWNGTDQIKTVIRYAGSDRQRKIEAWEFNVMLPSELAIYPKFSRLRAMLQATFRLEKALAEIDLDAEVQFTDGSAYSEEQVQVAERLSQDPAPLISFLKLKKLQGVTFSTFRGFKNFHENGRRLFLPPELGMGLDEFIKLLANGELPLVPLDASFGKIFE